ncbi:MAG: O-antigen ligase family protein [Verrucomicrobia bacterium]|nr:O-antigen ligase family protein [Verrucomicrobiota bacterium]
MGRSKSFFDYLLEFPLFLAVAFLCLVSPIWLGSVDQDSFAVMAGVSGIMLCLHGVILAIRPRARQLWLPPTYAVLFFLGYVIWRYTQADIEFVARQELMRLMIYSGIFIVITQQLHKQSWVFAILAVLIILGTGQAVLAIIQYITDSKTVLGKNLPMQYWGRASGTYICPNHLGGLLELIAPVALALGLTSKLSPSLKIALIYCALVMVAGLIVTFSRGAWFSLGVSLTVLTLILLRRPHLRFATLGVFILLTAGVWFFAKSNHQLNQRIHEVTLDSGKVDNIRFLIWKPAFQIWKNNPWFGTGPGHFDYVFPKYRPENFQYRAGYAHNDYLNTLTDYGLLGFILALSPVLLICFNFKSIWKGNSRSQDGFGQKNSNKEPVLLGTSLGILAILIHSFVDFNLQIPANAALTATLLAVAASQWRNATRQFWISPNWSIVAIQIPCFIAAGIFLTSSAFTLFSTHHLDSKLKNSQSASEQFTILTNLCHLDPQNFLYLTKLGDFHRLSPDPDDLQLALNCYQNAIDANPFHYKAFLKSGIVLDQLYQFDNAHSAFLKALAIDPNGYDTLAHFGRHLCITDQNQQAYSFLSKSKQLQFFDNPISDDWLPIVKARLNIQ